MSDWLAYENEDGEAWVALEDQPDRDLAGLQLAEGSGLVYSFEGQVKQTVQDCECIPTTEHCLDDKDGQPCRVREKIECWAFQSWGFGDKLDRPSRVEELLNEMADVDDDAILYVPGQPKPVNKSHLLEVLATVTRAVEAQSVGMFDD